MARPMTHLTWYQTKPPKREVKALILPHAAYPYCGTIINIGMRMIAPHITHVIILGTLHHTHGKNSDGGRGGIFSSAFESWETETGPVTVKNLLHLFPNQLSPEEDAKEHSIEIYFSLLPKNVLVTPLYVSSFQTEDIAKLLSLFQQPHVVIIASSDFCHWGSNYKFSPTKENVPVSELIRQLDMNCVNAIKEIDIEKWQIAAKENNICGRAPISCLLTVLKAYSVAYKKGHCFKYKHSSNCDDPKKVPCSVVSYAGIGFEVGEAEE